MSERHKVALICSRADAIAQMLDTAQPNDTLLLAGKGHEA
jgi:UDP-N-acetylmuramyl tripeptide synthase